MYFAFHLDNECTQDCLKVEEDYYNIKHLLGVEQNENTQLKTKHRIL